MASTLAPGALFDGKFEIIQLAGVGGMGTVYRARNVALDRIVALKIVHSNLGLDADSNRRFRQEVQTASQLVHPNITAISGFGVSDQQPYAVFEFLEGETLSECIAGTPPLSSDRFFALMIQACSGLQFAHDKGVIHRDLKPSNFMIVQKPSAARDATSNSSIDLLKILDFGIAKVMREGPEIQRLTATGAVVGTPLYMSPEQCRGESATAQSDIYGLGCVMYSAVYGNAPHRGDTSFELLYAHMHHEPSYAPVPTNYPPGIVSVLQKALAKDPRRRYESMTALSEDLTRLAQGVSVAPGEFTVQKPKSFSRKNLLVPLTVACILTVCLLLSLQIDPFSFVTKSPITIWHETHSPSAVTKMYEKISNLDDQLDFEKTITNELLRNPDTQGAILLASMKSSARGISASERMQDHLGYFIRRVPSAQWTEDTFNTCLKAFTQSETNAGNTDPEIYKMLEIANSLSGDGNHTTAARAYDRAFRLCNMKSNLHDKHLMSLVTGIKSLVLVGNLPGAIQHADFVRMYALPKMQAEPLREVAIRSDRMLNHTLSKQMWQDYVSLAERSDCIPTDKKIEAFNRLAIDQALAGDLNYKKTAERVWEACEGEATPAKARQLLVCGDVLTYCKDSSGATRFYKAAEEMASTVLQREPKSAHALLVRCQCIHRNRKIDKGTRAVLLATRDNIKRNSQRAEPMSEAFGLVRQSIETEEQARLRESSGRPSDKAGLERFHEYCINACLFQHIGDAKLTAQYLGNAALEANALGLPQSPKFAIASGAHYLRARLVSLARKEFEKALQYRPVKEDQREIRTQLALCAYEEKSYAVAKLGLQQYFNDLGKNYQPQTLRDRLTFAERNIMLGEILAHEGNYSPADNHFREAYETTSTDELRAYEVHKKAALRQIDCQRRLALSHAKLDYNPEAEAHKWEQQLRSSEAKKTDSRPN